MAKRASEITLSAAVVDELRSLSASDADRVVTFLQHLAENPYDQTLIRSATAKGDLFASSVTAKLFVYWSFGTKSRHPGLMIQPKINVLGLARKRANHRLVPLSSVIDEKLQSA
jgi:uncharacterized membrane protein YgcG